MEAEYPPGSVVWVRLDGGQQWWPGEVASQSDATKVLDEMPSKTPFAVVKFFEEDGLHTVTSKRNIYPFQCEKKSEFLKKGRELKQAGKDELHSKFEADVNKAESLCRPATTPLYAPVKKERLPLFSALVQAKSNSPSYMKAPSAERFDYNVTDSVRSSSRDPFYGDDLVCTPRIRKQPSTPRPVEIGYSCDTCGYQTARRENIVRHHKSHSDPYNFLPSQDSERRCVFEKIGLNSSRNKKNKSKNPRKERSKSQTPRAYNKKKPVEKSRLNFIPTPKKRKIVLTPEEKVKEVVVKKKSKASQLVGKTPFSNPFEDDEDVVVMKTTTTANTTGALSNKPSPSPGKSGVVTIDDESERLEKMDEEKLSEIDKRLAETETVAWEDFIKNSPIKTYQNTLPTMEDSKLDSSMEVDEEDSVKDVSSEDVSHLDTTTLSQNGTAHHEIDGKSSTGVTEPSAVKEEPNVKESGISSDRVGDKLILPAYARKPLSSEVFKSSSDISEKPAVAQVSGETSNASSGIVTSVSNVVLPPSDRPFLLKDENITDDFVKKPVNIQEEAVDEPMNNVTLPLELDSPLMSCGMIPGAEISQSSLVPGNLVEASHHQQNVVLENPDITTGEIVVTDGSLHTTEIVVGEEIEVQEIEIQSIGDVTSDGIILEDATVLQPMEVHLETDVPNGITELMNSTNSATSNPTDSLVHCFEAGVTVEDSSYAAVEKSDVVSDKSSIPVMYSADDINDPSLLITSVNQADCSTNIPVSGQLDGPNVLEDASKTTPDTTSGYLAQSSDADMGTVHSRTPEGAMNISDDDDDDLPPAFELSEVKAEFQIDDIVFAKYRGMFWPAVVLKVYKREKKMKVMFVDAPEDQNHITVPFRRVKFYRMMNEAEVQEQSSACKDEQMRNAYQKSLKRVFEFMCKRATSQGPVSPTKYFKCPYLYGREELVSTESRNPEAAASPDNDTDNNYESTSNQTENSGNNDDDDDYDDDVVEDDSAPMTDSEFKAMEVLREQNVRLIDTLKTEDCMKYLMDINKKKIPSDRHEKYFHPSLSVQRQLKYHGYGPIEDQKQQDEVFRYLLNKFKSLVKPSSNIFAPTYILDVWMPEGVVWSISKLENISKEEAESRFLKQEVP